jgi:hypothetical protein
MAMYIPSYEIERVVRAEIQEIDAQISGDFTDEYNRLISKFAWVRFCEICKEDTRSSQGSIAKHFNVGRSLIGRLFTYHTNPEDISPVSLDVAHNIVEGMHVDFETIAPPGEIGRAELKRRFKQSHLLQITANQRRGAGEKIRFEPQDDGFLWAIDRAAAFAERITIPKDQNQFNDCVHDASKTLSVDPDCAAHGFDFHIARQSLPGHPMRLSSDLQKLANDFQKADDRGREARMHFAFIKTFSYIVERMAHTSPSKLSVPEVVKRISLTTVSPSRPGEIEALIEAHGFDRLCKLPAAELKAGLFGRALYWSSRMTRLMREANVLGKEPIRYPEMENVRC